MSRLAERLREMQTIRRNTTPLSVSIGLAQEAADELDRLHARVAELEVDAERSAWLFEHYSSLMCTHQGMAPKVTFQPCLLNKDFAPDMLRAAIDTARKTKL